MGCVHEVGSQITVSIEKRDGSSFKAKASDGVNTTVGSSTEHQVVANTQAVGNLHRLVEDLERERKEIVFKLDSYRTKRTALGLTIDPIALGRAMEIDL